MSQPSIPKGTRDFSPDVMVKRNYIFSAVRKSFERFGYQPLETPSFENISTLTGKYGDEGDQLIFKVLKSGDFLSEINPEILAEKNSKKVASVISDKALRYDLTVPFARFVVMNQNKIAFPFKRYQIQPVWRADRPQKGRYREFYQCDADVVGSNSLLNEVELVQIFDEVLSDLKVPSIIKINNRKILTGIAEVAGVSDRMMEMTIAIDKLDKIGLDGVVKELNDRGFSENSVQVISQFLVQSNNKEQNFETLETALGTSEIGMKGIEELKYVLDYVASIGLRDSSIEFDVTLARGLNYYTGSIFEVKVKGISLGSICGGGRYDDLTGIFGLQGVSGVGISFGADRIYDAMSELNLFPETLKSNTKLLFANFGPTEEKYSLPLLKALREAGINTEIYPDAAKMKKQFKYADDKGIPYVAVIGEQEMQSNKINLKDMTSGDQVQLTLEELITKMKSII
jgi:histidyl-tRNA synthetase